MWVLWKLMKVQSFAEVLQGFSAVRDSFVSCLRGSAMLQTLRERVNFNHKCAQENIDLFVAVTEGPMGTTASVRVQEFKKTMMVSARKTVLAETDNFIYI
jgi:hypothetical protein